MARIHQWEDIRDMKTDVLEDGTSRTRVSGARHRPSLKAIPEAINGDAQPAFVTAAGIEVCRHKPIHS